MKPRGSGRTWKYLEEYLEVLKQVLVQDEQQQQIQA
jgi:hypothetical protein